MKIRAALLAGIAGALAMSLAMLMMRMFGLSISLEAILGSVLERAIPVSAMATGLVLHLMIGAVAGLVYAGLFEFGMQRAGALAGAGLGLCHGLIAGLFMSGIPAMNPLGSGSHSAPGVFLQNVYLGPAVFILLHVLFGAVAGMVYGHPLQKPHLYTHRTVSH